MWVLGKTLHFVPFSVWLLKYVTGCSTCSVEVACLAPCSLIAAHEDQTSHGLFWSKPWSLCILFFNLRFAFSMSPWFFMILYVYNRIVGVIQVLVDASCQFFLYSRIMFVHLHWFICFHSPSCHDLISITIFTKSDFYSARLGSKRGDASEHEASRRAAWPKKIETSIRSFPKSWGYTLNHPFFPDVQIFYYQFHFRILQNMNQAFWGTPIYGNYIQVHNGPYI